MSLSETELTMIANAISWALHLPCYRSIPPHFSDPERTRLQEVFEQICSFRSPDSHGAMDSSQLTINGHVLISSESEINNLISCARTFYSEIGHSPDEVLVVTGLSIDKLEELMTRIDQVDQISK